jgi:hypothetical protein
VEETAALPDGREALVRVGVPDDPYIPKRELDTVAIEIVIGDRVEATLNTILEADQDSEARALAREVAAGLRSGSLEPTAHSIEPLADSLPS